MGDHTPELRRGELVGDKNVYEMLDYCLSSIEEDGFHEGIDWDTKITDSLTLEEMIGALVRSETYANQILERERETLLGDE